jgi:hypothetical protein
MNLVASAIGNASPFGIPFSRLYHFTLAHSGLRSSLHTLNDLPYVGSLNVRYIMVRYSFDDGTRTRKNWRPCHGAPLLRHTASSSALPS